MPPLCVAIVGCGRISDLHELGYRGREDARIVAVCDARKGRARARARAWGVDKVYTDYQKMYENFVFYPPHVRARQMIEAGEIGAPQGHPLPQPLHRAHGGLASPAAVPRREDDAHRGRAFRVARQLY
jgi:predicted dehydrogenase